ncbi:Ankyrin repeat domain-containing protein 17 [Cichlidogyrus casuarinus]|uniref:Ankyrin repeat domain-containing protein 17 n=1 Tax=Cichlidogyrus casuarinus TaxID=1844966 RepID=A0ABD2Q2H3_9PLAT
MGKLPPTSQMNIQKILQIFYHTLEDQNMTSEAPEIIAELARKYKLLEQSNSNGVPTGTKDIETLKKLLGSGDYNVNEVNEGETALSTAVSANSPDLVGLLLKYGANPNLRGKKGDSTPLMDAASAGYTDIVRLLLEHGACVMQTSNAENTALHYAATSGHLECVRLLLDYNSPLEQQNETGHTPLMEATNNAHLEVAKLLVQRGANINSFSSEFKESALTLASYKGHTEMVRFLLEMGADHEHRTDEMHNALMEASMDGHVEVARLLLAHGASVHLPPESFESPLTLAACGGHTELAHLLIGYGANIEEVNDEGYTPLMEASREGYEETVALLLACGADVNTKTEETQETALTLAACGGFIGICEMLIKAGADIEVGGFQCSTPLMEAAQEGHNQLVTRLIEAGANVNAVTGTGETALHYAADNGHVRVCRELILAGALKNAQALGGKTPLMKAARAGYLNVVQFFIEIGCPIDAVTSDNDATALSLACAGGHANGADPHISLKDGCTMLIEAAKSGKPEVVCLILDYPNSIRRSSDQMFDLPLDFSGLPDVMSQPVDEIMDSIPYDSGTKLLDDMCTQGVDDLDESVDAVLNPLNRLDDAAASCLMIDPSTKLAFAYGNVSTLMNEPEEPFSLDYLQLQPKLNGDTNNPFNMALSNAFASGWKQGINLNKAFECHQRKTQEEAKKSLLKAAQSTFKNLTADLLKNFELSEVRSILNAFNEFIPRTEDDVERMLKGVDKENVALSSFEKSISKRKAAPKTNGWTHSPGTLSTNGSPISSSCSSSASLDNLSFVPLKKRLSHKAVRDDNNLPALLRPSLRNVVLTELRRIRRLVHNGVISEASPCLHCLLPDKPNHAPATKQHAKKLARWSYSSPSLSTNDLQRYAQIYAAATKHFCKLDLPKAPRSRSLEKTLQGSSLLTRSFSVDALSDLVGTPNLLLRSPDVAVEDLEPQLSYPSLCQCQFCCKMKTLASTQHSAASYTDPSFYDQLLPPHLLHDEEQFARDVQAGYALLESMVQEPKSVSAERNQMERLSPDQYHQIMLYFFHLGRIQGLFQLGEIDAAKAEQMARCDPASLPDSYFGHLLNKAALLRSHQLGHSSFLSDSALPHPRDLTRPVSPLLEEGDGQGKNPCRIDVNACTESGLESALTMVCSQGHLELVRLLLERGADVEHRDKKSHTPLHAAVLANQKEVVCLLLDHGADIEATPERSKDTPLSMACHNGRIEIVRELLARGANKEHRNLSDYTPLSLAASSGKVDVIECLLQHGAEINSRSGSKLGISPLMLASMNGHANAVKKLLDHGSDINAHIETNRNTALTLACFQGRHEVVELLVKRGANFEHRAKSGLTPLMEAASGDYVEVGRILVYAGADCTAVATLLSLLPPTRAIYASLACSSNTQVEAKNKKGSTSLWLACNGGHIEVCRVLIEFGAHVDAQDNRHVSCLMAAFRKGNLTVVNLLVPQVSHFPPDKDLLRHMKTIYNDEVSCLRARTHACTCDQLFICEMRSRGLILPHLLLLQSLVAFYRSIARTVRLLHSNWYVY